MTFQTIKAHVDDRGVGYLTLARPEVRNAMNGTMYDEARAVVRDYDEDPKVRVVVLSGEGQAFCAGGDFKYQQSQSGRPREERIAEAQKLASWLRELDFLSKPLIGRINGAAYAGGLGLVSTCDIAIGLKSETFAITESRIGMLPGMIAPYVVKRLGEANARRLFLNARPFSGEEAVGYGILSMAVEADDLDAAVEREVDLALRCSPKAIAAAKNLIRYVDRHNHDENFIYTVDRVADMWDWADAAEGMASFFEKRLPAWDWRADK
ncbi:enoyl-CoA hydratase-related protein [Martelella soudanensis]|uniref:enoyl-CoA hydratase-related protein n=1 Tax=unclassified Martelella TaxID=2629616 RepID=UPI0015DD98DC|nr:MULTISPECIES: enoyl-CoA hydratase-related protein [unclassified Martelella]